MATGCRPRRAWTCWKASAPPTACGREPMSQQLNPDQGSPFMNVPLLDLKAQYLTIKLEIDAAIAAVLQSQHFILGPEVERCEKEVAAYSGCAFGIGVSSGTDALLACLMAENIGRGDEVITTPYTFFATVGAITRVGATPVFVDIDPVTFNIDSHAIASKVTPRTK